MKIVRIEWGRLVGERPRAAGGNARLGPHGKSVSVPIARITRDDGVTGIGFCRGNQSLATSLLGNDFEALFRPESGVALFGRAFEYPLWDLAGNAARQPVYALTAQMRDMSPPADFRVRCYDTSLYFDDSPLTSDEEAAALLAEEAREGQKRGHRAFKIKVGRGARWMPVEAGTRRDVAVIRAVREAVGPAATLLLDANNGWNLNLTKRVLAETADCDLYWIEEAFHEDAELYSDLKNWMKAEGLTTRIADGEGQASPTLLEWAREGLIDVVQYDIFGHGLMRWLEISQELDAWGVQTAPHHYGAHLGNYVSCHLASAVRHFAFVEWDEATTPGIAATGYAVQDGSVSVPNAPGFGITLDENAFQEAVTASGWKVER